MTVEASMILPNGEVDSVSLPDGDEARLRQGLEFRYVGAVDENLHEKLRCRIPARARR